MKRALSASRYVQFERELVKRDIGTHPSDYCAVLGIVCLSTPPRTFLSSQRWG